MLLSRLNCRDDCLCVVAEYQEVYDKQSRRGYQLDTFGAHGVYLEHFFFPFVSTIVHSQCLNQ